MGMTIENCKKRLVIEKELAIKTGLNHDANGTLADAIDVAVDTMNKYQKIEQAYSAYLETTNPETLADLISTII